MLILISLPSCLTTVFQGMPGVWECQYRLLRSWFSKI
jgi:hypothetical protein